MRISDWSSDVCSSDLWLPVGRDRAHIGQRFPLRACASRSHGDAMRMNVLSVRFPNGGKHRFVKACPPTDAGLANIRLETIGRASCRERVCQYVALSVVALSCKKN